MDASDESRVAGDAVTDRPRALIHEKILAVAEENPTASMADIADEVSGVSVDLVDRVLEEYGDPGADPGADGATEGTALDDATTGGEVGPGPEAETETAGEPATGSPTTGTEPTTRSPEAFGERQLSVLRVVHERPDATQGEIADELGVSRGTVSRRLGKVDGFEWTDREAFVRRLFGDETGNDEPEAGEGTVDATDGPDGTAAPEGEAESGESGDAQPKTESDPRGVDDSLAAAVTDLSGVVEELASDVDRLQDRLDSDESAPTEPEDAPDAGGTATGRDAVLDDPELAHKVVHACVDADYVSEDEELRVLRAILGGSDSQS